MFPVTTPYGNTLGLVKREKNASMFCLYPDKTLQIITITKNFTKYIMSTDI